MSKINAGGGYKPFSLVLCLLMVIAVSAACAGSSSLTAPPAGNIPAYSAPDGDPVNPYESAGRTLEGHVLAAENSVYELYLDEGTLGIILKDKASGAYMRSTVADPETSDNQQWQGLYGSGVTLEYIMGTNLNPTRADLIFTEHTIQLFYRPGGFSAEVHFPAPQISYTLNVTLTESGFTAEIPQSSIREGDPDIVVGAFYVYPFLGYSRQGADEGYMFIPDGQGALIELKDNEGRFPQPFSEPVYGENVGLAVETAGAMFDNYRYQNDPEQILMPCYGMVHTEKQVGFLCVVESGAENARIEAWPNGASTVFDWISAKFTYRHVFMQPTGRSSGTVQSRTPRANRLDIKLRFLFVTGQDADYAGLAVRYRAYLAETGAFASAVMDEYRTGVDFFGAEKRDWALFKLNVNMTTFKQAENILKDLDNSGVSGVFSRYGGWHRGGASDGKPVLGFSPAGNLGGKKDLNSLYATAESLGGELFLNVDPLNIQAEANPLEALNALKRVTGRTVEFYGGEWKWLTPSRTLAVSEQTAAAFAENGVRADVGAITSSLTAFMEDGHYYDRADNAVMYEKSVSAYESPALTHPFVNLWRYASALTEMPSGGSGYLYVWREIPFLSMVTSGKIPVYFEYANFQPNRREFFLKLIETGARPVFLVTAEDSSLLRNTQSNDIYSSLYDLYKEQIIEYDKILTALHAYIGDASIIEHYAEGRAVMVTYDNGLILYVNYGETPAVINGVPVDAMSFIAEEGGV